MRIDIIVKDIVILKGKSVNPRWRHDVQGILTMDGKRYYNSPKISGDIFEKHNSYNVYVGNKYGPVDKRYHMISTEERK